MDLDEKKVGLIVIAAMVISFVWMVNTGISSANLLPLVVFTVTLSTAAVLFGDWFDNDE